MVIHHATLLAYRQNVCPPRCDFTAARRALPEAYAPFQIQHSSSAAPSGTRFQKNSTSHSGGLPLISIPDIRQLYALNIMGIDSHSTFGPAPATAKSSKGKAPKPKPKRKPAKKKAEKAEPKVEDAPAEGAPADPEE